MSHPDSTAYPELPSDAPELRSDVLAGMTPRVHPLSSAERWSRLRKEIRSTFIVGLPVIISQLLQMSMSFVDTVMAGRLSPLDLAAVAIGSSTFMPVMVFSMASIFAVNPIVAQNLGARRFHLIGRNARQALWLSQIFALISFILVWNADHVMRLVNVTPDIIPLAHGYLKALSWGIFPIYAYVSMRNFNEGLSVTRPAMFFALAGALINIPLNYILMFGKFGFPRLGAVGTGYATAIVYTVMAVSILIFLGRFKPYRRFGIFSQFRWPEPTFMKELLKIGLPIGVSASLEVTMFAAVSLMMGTLGAVTVASHQVAINFASLTFMVPFGLSIAITARVGKSVGQGNLQAARFRGLVGILVCTLFMSLTALIITLFPEGIARIYTNDTTVIALTVQLLYLAAIFQISDGVQISALGALRGMKDTKIPMYFNLFAYAVVGLPLAAYLGLRLEWGGVGMWTGLIIGLTIAAVLHLVRFNALSKRRVAGHS